MTTKLIRVEPETLGKIEQQYPIGSWTQKLEQLLTDCNKCNKNNTQSVTNVTHQCKFDITLIKDAIDQAIHEATQR